MGIRELWAETAISQGLDCVEFLGPYFGERSDGARAKQHHGYLSHLRHAGTLDLDVGFQWVELECVQHREDGRRLLVGVVVGDWRLSDGFN